MDDIKLNKYLIVDFDSTFVSGETLDELAKIVFKNNSKQKELVKEIEEITKLGMEGKLSFKESLEKRMKLLDASKKDLEVVIKFMKQKISKSILRNKSFFKKNSKKIYIISGGFIEVIYPVVKDFGIIKSHILAGSLIFNDFKKITGFDKNSLLNKPKGKAKAVKSLNLKGEVVILGDGFTDLEVKLAGEAKKFIYFAENIKRKELMTKADFVAKNFKEVIKNLK